MAENLTTDLGRVVRARRSQLGLSVAHVAELLGLTQTALRDLERGSGNAGGSYLYVNIQQVLGAELPFWSSSCDAVSELDANAARLGCWGDRAPLLKWARQAYELDSRITLLSSSGVLPAQRAGEVAAVLPAPALPPVELPDLGDPRRRRRRRRGSSSSWSAARSGMDYAADGTLLAQLLREHLDLPPGVPVDLDDAAGRVGFGIAGAPAEEASATKSVLLRVASTALIVVNTRLHPTVSSFSIAHTLGHLLAGDAVAAGIVDLVEDEDDDSIYCCLGASSVTCQRADAFAAELLAPEAYLRAASEDLAGVTDRPRSWLRLVHDLSTELEVPPHLIAQLLTDVVPAEAAGPLLMAVTRRAPFGGSARRGDPGAVCSEDLALPAGPGDYFLPGALYDRSVSACVEGVLYSPPQELLVDRRLPAADRAALLGDPHDDGQAGYRAHHRARVSIRAAQLATGQDDD